MTEKYFLFEPQALLQQTKRLPPVAFTILIRIRCWVVDQDLEHPIVNWEMARAYLGVTRGIWDMAVEDLVREGFLRRCDGLAGRRGNYEIVTDFIEPARTLRRQVSQSTRQRVFEVGGGQCTYCQVELTTDDRSASSYFHCDHVVPVAAGGTNDFENLVAACRSCNLSKRHYRLRDWEGRPNASQ